MLTSGLYILIGVAAVVVGSRVRLLESYDWACAQPSTKDFMEAVSYGEHGSTSVLKLNKNYQRPTPKDNQVLVQVKASAINPVDFKFRRNDVPNFVLPKPKIPGSDVAGIVVEVGSKVAQFKVGDRVAAMMPTLGSRWGAAAEYAAVKESILCKIGESTDFISAASLPLVSLTSVQALGRIHEPKGKKILIHAGAGGVGTFAIQYAKNVLGMYVATTASSPKTELLKSLGADLVIDYRTEDFSEVCQGYDAVLDTMSFVYEEKTLYQGSKVLKKNGHYLNVLSSDSALVNGKEKSIGFLSLQNLVKHKLANFVFPGSMPNYDLIAVQPNGHTLQLVLDLVEQGQIRSVIDKTYPLSKATDAYDYIETGHATGKVVLEH
jgi:alcohol dehydrogenase